MFFCHLLPNCCFAVEGSKTFVRSKHHIKQNKSSCYFSLISDAQILLLMIKFRYSLHDDSSDPSEQSMSPSQIAPLSMHSPLAQVASYEAQAAGGLAVGIIPKQLLSNQSSDHLRSDHSPVFQER